ncbi:MAG: hypothetical protein Q9159_006815, partial [Coniocarpon cinnabarinum]
MLLTAIGNSGLGHISTCEARSRSNKTSNTSVQGLTHDPPRRRPMSTPPGVTLNLPIPAAWDRAHEADRWGRWRARRGPLARS